MRIVTFVKYVPDATGDRTFESDNTVDRSVDGLLSELDEYAVEEALQIIDGDKKSDLIALTVGPDDAKDAVKKSLQMGATKGVHVNDDALAGSDALATSKVLAAALKKIGEEDGPVDLVITGFASTDAGMSVVPAQVAELAGLPAVTQVSELSVDGDAVKGRRDGDTSSQHLSAGLPALVAVTDQINEPRYPSFKGILGAKKKKIDVYDLEDLGVDAAEVGAAGAATEVTELNERPPRTAGEIITDEGDGGTKLVEWLAAKKLV